MQVTSGVGSRGHPVPVSFQTHFQGAFELPESLVGRDRQPSTHGSISLGFIFGLYSVGPTTFPLSGFRVTKLELGRWISVSPATQPLHPPTEPIRRLSTKAQDPPYREFRPDLQCVNNPRSRPVEILVAVGDVHPAIPHSAQPRPFPTLA
jgi:hypothetical protein